MASRRLDISSLLCETQGAADEPSSPARPASGQLSPSPRHPGRTYASSVHPTPGNAHNSSVPAEQQSHRRQQHQRVPSSSDAGGSSRPLAPLPLSIQSASARRRTPSPPISPFRPGSPTRRSALHGRQVEDGNGRLAIGEFPRLGVAQPYATRPLLYTQHSPPPPPPLSPSAHIYDSRLERRSAPQFQVNSYNYSPLPQTRRIPTSSPSRVPPVSPQLHSTSPQTVPYSARPVTFVGVSGQTPADLFRLQDAGSHRSVSLSPTAPMSAPLSGISGLDVLVQAATEERERIDGNRLLSGGDDPQRTVNLTARSQPLNLSPVSFRGDTLQPLSSVPPHSASAYASVHHSADQGDAFYNGQGLSEGGRPIKRRRSSPEPSTEQNRSPHIQTTSNEMFKDASFPRASAVAHGQSPLDGRNTSSERTIHSPKAASHILHLPLAKHGPKHGPMPSSQGSRDGTGVLETDVLPRSTVPQGSIAGPALVSASGRRSPPRSKPRPKKPGSAALAVMEKGLRGVVLSENEYNDSSEGVGKDNSQRRNLNPGPSKGIRHTSKQVKSSGEISESLPSNKEVAVDDEQDVDEFFLSAFDSPRSTGKQAVPQADEGEFLQTKGERQRPELSRKNHEYTKRTISAHLALFSSKSRSPSPSAAGNISNRCSPAGFSQDDGGGVPKHTPDAVEADSELLDELADAAGAATSDDDRTDFDDQETDAMEVDVENELLSLIDGPLEPTSKLHNMGPSTSHIHGLHTVSQSRGVSVEFNRMSMPPPDVSKAIGAPAKEAKRGPTKAKAKSKADDTDGAKLSSKAITKLGDAAAKALKTKLKTKPRPPKAVALEMHKITKSGKGPQTPVSATLPVFHTSAGVPTDESFPVVTSSGRMVTKSKKSAAAAAAAASGQTLANGRKKPAGVSGNGDGNSSRSRSHSVMPCTSVDPETHREKSAKIDEEKHKDAEDPTADDDDKLYCVCKTKYDEDRVMIACDRCDEWYHTQCVNMPDLEVDLVDQFVCPNCIARNPVLQLCTTYKQRCFSGLSHYLPNSPEACHKPSRGAYSKYCSDECGVKHLHRKIQAWASDGGSVLGLWETVKDTKRREGFVIREPGRTLPKKIIAELRKEGKIDPVNATEHKHLVDMSLVPQETKDSIIERLETRLQSIVREREARKREMQVIVWREKLLQSASERAESVHECGWDQRLCFGDEEWMEFGEGVLESYEESTPDGHDRTDNASERIDMEVDGQVADGEWWCRGKKKCDRHAGWQKLRAAEIKAEREGKEETLVKLTTREREIRSRIEDIRHPQSRCTTSGPTLNFLFLPNGSEDVVKKGKKKTNAVA
ncbi:hypothetical protein M0805_004279 [Coniferiporia weirii]|nr:hypothetical protein M0805_004279 [Coniferiporia weirii]